MLEVMIRIWDITALSLIAEEAGGEGNGHRREFNICRYQNHYCNQWPDSRLNSICF
jgi:fructose-1,6-bisphosphatase/inositol monophosphatase family enzyme